MPRTRACQTRGQLGVEEEDEADEAEDVHHDARQDGSHEQTATIQRDGLHYVAQQYALVDDAQQVDGEEWWQGRPSVTPKDFSEMVFLKFFPSRHTKKNLSRGALCVCFLC